MHPYPAAIQLRIYFVAIYFRLFALVYAHFRCVYKLLYFAAPFGNCKQTSRKLIATFSCCAPSSLHCGAILCISFMLKDRGASGQSQSDTVTAYGPRSLHTTFTLHTYAVKFVRKATTHPSWLRYLFGGKQFQSFRLSCYYAKSCFATFLSCNSCNTRILRQTSCLIR